MADSATLEEQCHQKKLFVGGLANAITTRALREHFQGFGNVVEAVVLRWPDGRSRGFGYVTFADTANANSALKMAHKIAGCDVDTKRAVPGTNKLFVGGLPQDATAAHMREYFEQFGVVSDAVVMMDPTTKRSRGFGFICFPPGHSGAAALAAALEQYSRHYLCGKWIEVKSAAPPSQMETQRCGRYAEAHADEGVVLSTLPALEESVTAPYAETVCAPETQELPTTPPGLDAPAELGNFQHCWSQPACPVVATVPYDARARFAHCHAPHRSMTPLPSLLVAGSRGNNHLEGKILEPMKVHISRNLNATESGQEENSGVFDASVELRRSLEQLLRLHSEQGTVHDAR
jgi:hypothetical protein